MPGNHTIGSNHPSADRRCSQIDLDPKTTKDRNRERKWEQEDKQEAKAEAAEVPPGDMPGA